VGTPIKPKGRRKVALWLYWRPYGVRTPLGSTRISGRSPQDAPQARSRASARDNWIATSDPITIPVGPILPFSPPPQKVRLSAPSKSPALAAIIVTLQVHA